MPTEVIQIPAGTYNLAGGGSRTVTTLTVTEPGGTLTIPANYAPTTNATAGASWSIRRNGTQVASGIVGTDAITHPTTGYTAGDTMTCRVISGAQTVTSAGKTLTAPTLTYIDLRGVRSNTATASPSLTFDLSAAQSGDELFILYSKANTSSSVPTDCTIAGVSAGAIVTTLGTQDQNRTQWVWKYTMPGAGSASTAVAFALPASTNNHVCTIAIVRGGAVIGASSLGAGGTVSSVNASVTPTNSRNIIIASMHAGTDPTSTSWTNATASGTSSTTRAALAKHEDETNGVSRTITATFTTAATASLALLCLEPA